MIAQTATHGMKEIVTFLNRFFIVGKVGNRIANYVRKGLHVFDKGQFVIYRHSLIRTEGWQNFNLKPTRRDGLVEFQGIDRIIRCTEYFHVHFPQ